MLCAYCGESASYTLKNGKFCCESHYSKCPFLKKKNSDAIKKAHSDGKMRYDQLDAHRNWNKGKTLEGEKYKVGGRKNKNRGRK